MTDKDDRGAGTPTERRIITALFVDVVGSTTLAESMDPEDWTDVVNRTVAVISECVKRYSGTIAQFAGDSILALFGAPTAHEDDPYRAIRTGLDILDAVDVLAIEVRREAGIEIKVRGGINTGLVVTGDLSAGDLNVYAALGDTANVAARMQALATPGSLMISESTYRLISTDVEVEDLGLTEIKGKSESMHVYRVESVQGIDNRTRGIPGLQSPLVGRDHELQTLLSLVETAQAGRGRMAAVIGEPGVGKSRLIRELHDRVSTIDGAQWLMGRCASYDEKRPYHLIASITRAMAGVTDSDDLETVERAVTTTTESIFGTGDPRVGHLLQLLGIADPLDNDKSNIQHGFYVTALCDLIAGLSALHRPLVLVCEDIHWADPSSAELLNEAMERTRDCPILIVVLTRPDRDSHGWDILVGARRQLAEALTEINLQALAETDSRRLVANLLSIESLPESLRRKVLEKADGNPFFLEEIVRMLIERGFVEIRDGRWVAKTEIADLEVPTTVHGLLAARVDMLPTDARRMGKVASVFGRQFEARLLDEILPSDDSGGGVPSMSPQLHQLEAHGFIQVAATQPQLEFKFRHALIHEVMYRALLKRERRDLHKSAALAIESIYGDRIDELAPALARHYKEAGITTKALSYVLMAGRQSLKRHAHHEAYDFFVDAGLLLDHMDESQPRLRIETVLGKVRAGFNFTPGSEAVASLQSVVGDAEQLDDVDLIARLSVELVRLWEIMGENSRPQYKQVLDRAFSLIPDIKDAGLRASLKGMNGQAKRAEDDYRGSAAMLEEAVLELERERRFSVASLNASYLADVHATVGDFQEAERWIARAMALAESSGDPNAVADAEIIRGKIASEKGELETALEHTRRGMNQAEEVGNHFCTLVGNFFAADQQLRLGHAEAAIPHLKRSSELSAFCNAGVFAVLGAAWLADARARLGDVDPSEFDVPLARARASKSRMGEGMVLSHRAIVLSGDEASRSAAFDDFDRAATLFEEIGARPSQARALHSHGLALEVAGDHKNAETHLRKAAQIFDELGIKPDPAGR